MKKQIALISILASILCGCATTPQSMMTCAPDVRKMSHVDDRLFRDVFGGMGGVGFADEVMFPNAKAKVITKINVIVPYDSHNVGIERWTVQHDGQDTCSYIVKFTPDGHGGTSFSTQKDDGKTSF